MLFMGYILMGKTESRTECDLADRTATRRAYSMHNVAWIVSKHFVSRTDRSVPRLSLIIFVFAIVGGTRDRSVYDALFNLHR